MKHSIACPYCFGPSLFDIELHSMHVVACTRCTHIYAIVHTTEGVITGKMPYKFLHEHFPKELESIRERQEMVAHEAGMWG